MYLQKWMLFLWALSFTDFTEVTGTLDDDDEDTTILDDDLPLRPNDKYSNDAYPYFDDDTDINNLYQEDRERFGCSDRLENALDQVRRRQISRRKTLQLDGYSLHQSLRSAPLDMYVTNMKIRLPPTGGWVKVDRCRFNPRNSSLQARLLFNDLTIMGKVNLFNDAELQREPVDPLPEDTCNMILRLRKAGIGFHTEPIRREKGHFNVRTNSHFVEPGFISVYAYGCEPKLREHKRHFREEFDEETDEGLSREMEDIFLKGIRSLLTSYMQKELQPAIKETLMRNMGYTVSYG
ncbi:uncharacterized protein LOC130904009 [Diorhabda carinulata]|uniref:uncharacterized protein LOC130904009 n=1 Tax=Diorhabda carinulata TaxID=1163345 RepID=UPI0025A2085F|nr:uncharacterized protein LOC130904009 [Diorhabda carinulata]